MAKKIINEILIPEKIKEQNYFNDPGIKYEVQLSRRIQTITLIPTARVDIVFDIVLTLG